MGIVHHSNTCLVHRYNSQKICLRKPQKCPQCNCQNDEFQPGLFLMLLCSVNSKSFVCSHCSAGAMQAPLHPSPVSAVWWGQCVTKTPKDLLGHQGGARALIYLLLTFSGSLTDKSTHIPSTLAAQVLCLSKCLVLIVHNQWLQYAALKQSFL